MDVQGFDSFYWLKAVNRFNALYTIPVIVISGIAGNLLALAVFVLTPLRRLTVSVYLAALSVTDLLFLVFLGIGWVDSVELKKIEMFRSDGICQIMVFMTFVVSFLSIWFIITFTAELYTSICCTRLHRVISRPKRATAIVAALVIISCVIYIFSFWFRAQNKTSDFKWACLFTGSSSSAIAFSVADTFLTLFLPLSLLLFMNIRIIHILSSVPNKGKNDEKQSPNSPHPSSSMASENLLTGAFKMAVCSRRTTSKHCDQSNQAQKDQRVWSSGHKDVIKKRSKDLNDFRKMNGKKISLTLSDGEININNSKGEMMALTRLVVQNNAFGITLSNNHSETRCVEKCEKRERTKTNSKTETNIVISATIPKNSYSSRKKKNLDQQRHSNVSCKSISFAEMWSRNSSIGDSVEEEACSELLKNQEGADDETETNQNATVCPEKAPCVSSTSSAFPNAMTHPQRRCLKMVLFIAIIFLSFNLPCHAIRLQSLVRFLFDPSYSVSEVESELQQLFQTIYYLTFVINFITYSSCSKSFQRAFLRLPRHMADTFSQLCCQACTSKRVFFCRQRHINELNDNSELVEIYISKLRLSQIPSFESDFNFVSPPCLLRLDSTTNFHSIESESCNSSRKNSDVKNSSSHDSSVVTTINVERN